MEALIKKKKKTGKLFSNWPLDKVQHNLKNVVVCREPVPGLTGAWILTRTQLQSHCTRMEKSLKQPTCKILSNERLN